VEGADYILAGCLPNESLSLTLFHRYRDRHSFQGTRKHAGTVF
jgi:hypothetical protein